MIRTCAVVAFMALGIVLVFPWLIVWSLLVGNPELLYATATRAIRVACRMAGLRIRVEGLEKIPPRACIFAANHASNLDPPALVAVIPRRVSFLAKKEVFRIPILATAMRVAQFVPVDRASREAATASVDIAARRLKEGLSFAVFPEGTRSPDGRMRPFKKGTFVMAIQAGAPVVPVSIVGAQNLMQKGKWTLRPGEVTIRFGPAVDASEYTLDRRGELLARVESLVAAGLPPEQQPAAPSPAANSSPAE
ncbi:MAG: 1-acyl-sn-glycerol-3-phosphate acyltransferase [Acidobacteriia bacterium]|nr:1-acyl-sn-glycerol-3-phosphate acyltransferase [Terriglobia bacterium]